MAPLGFLKSVNDWLEQVPITALDFFRNTFKTSDKIKILWLFQILSHSYNKKKPLKANDESL